MSKKRVFRPGLSEELECRMVLSHFTVRGPSVIVGGLMPRSQALTKQTSQSIVALTNQSFDSFVNDYTQARAAYMSTITGIAPAASAPATPDVSAQAAFKLYTQSRVNLLAQQITSNFLTSTAALSKSGNGYVLPSLVRTKINGLAPMSEKFAPGTLGQALTAAIPAVNSSPEAASLNALAQDQSIEAARVSVVNGISVIRNGDFGVKNNRHH